VVIFNAVTVHDHNTRFFRVCGVDKHTLGHGKLNSTMLQCGALGQREHLIVRGGGGGSAGMPDRGTHLVPFRLGSWL
ncbi:hypothetical protein, partial [Gluconobacter sp.]|uniref:hypothetical protein n=1 Tax=Gluconobacter sp. TaxID=1876758 RepID=UPI0039ED0E2C